MLLQLLREARRADGLESELKTLTRELESRVEAKLAEHEARTAGILQEHRTYESKLRAEIEKLHREAASKLRKAEVRENELRELINFQWSNLRASLYLKSNVSFLPRKERSVIRVLGVV